MSFKLRKITIHIILTALVIVTFFPLIYTLLGSFKSNRELLAHPEWLFPHDWTFDNYKIAVTSPDFNVPTLMINSVIYTVSTVIILVLTSSVSAYAFERGNFRGKEIIFAIFTALMFINMGPITVYPSFKILAFLHIPISLGGLIFKSIFAIPIVQIFLIRGYIRSLPKTLDEAAKIDGCGFLGIFFKIQFPLLKPILITVALLAFQGSWNEYLMPAIFTTSHPEQRTLMVGLMTLKSGGAAASSWNLMLSGSVIALLPVIIAFIFANKYFVHGITEGAVKG